MVRKTQFKKPFPIKLYWGKKPNTIYSSSIISGGSKGLWKDLSFELTIKNFTIGLRVLFSFSKKKDIWTKKPKKVE